METSTSSIISPSAESIFPKVSVYGLRSFSVTPLIGVNILEVMLMASGPDTRITPIAPPCAVAIAQIVSCWFIVCRKLILQVYPQFVQDICGLFHRMWQVHRCLYQVHPLPCH